MIDKLGKLGTNLALWKKLKSAPKDGGESLIPRNFLVNVTFVRYIFYHKDKNIKLMCTQKRDISLCKASQSLIYVHFLLLSGEKIDHYPNAENLLLL